MDIPEDDREQYEARVQQLQQAERELELAQHRTAALRKIVEGFSELHPELDAHLQGAATTTSPSGERPSRKIVRRSPTGKRAVALLLQQADDLLTVGEIMEQLQARGTAPASEEALRTMLNRMFNNDGTVEKGDKGGRLAYRWSD